jgi:hypothetical protein
LNPNAAQAQIVAQRFAQRQVAGHAASPGWGVGQGRASIRRLAVSTFAYSAVVSARRCRRNLADLGQRSARVQHRGGRGVPQPVRGDVTETGAAPGEQHDRGDSVGGQRPVRRLRPDEHGTALCGVGAGVLQVVDDGLSDIGGQG